MRSSQGMAVAFTNNLNANTEAVARAIWSKIQNKTRKNNAPNNLKNLWTLKSRVNHNAKPNTTNKYYKLNAPKTAANYGAASAPAVNEFSNALNTFPVKPNSRFKRLKNRVKRMGVKKNVSAAPAAKQFPWIGANSMNGKKYFNTRPNLAMVNTLKKNSGAKRTGFLGRGPWNYKKASLNAQAFWANYNAKNANLQQLMKNKKLQAYKNLGRNINNNRKRYPQHKNFFNLVNSWPAAVAKKNALLAKNRTALLSAAKSSNNISKILANTEKQAEVLKTNLNKYNYTNVSAHKNAINAYIKGLREQDKALRNAANTAAAAEANARAAAEAAAEAKAKANKNATNQAAANAAAKAAKNAANAKTAAENAEKVKKNLMVSAQEKANAAAKAAAAAAAAAAANAAALASAGASANQYRANNNAAPRNQRNRIAAEIWNRAWGGPGGLRAAKPSNFPRIAQEIKNKLNITTLNNANALKNYMKSNNFKNKWASLTHPPGRFGGRGQGNINRSIGIINAMSKN